MAIFTGSGVAIVTPFHENGEVNYEMLGELIEFQIAHKTDAIIICGTTGEASTMSHEEHLECIRYAVEKTCRQNSGHCGHRIQLHRDSRLSFSESGNIRGGRPAGGDALL